MTHSQARMFHFGLLLIFLAVVVAERTSFAADKSSGDKTIRVTFTNRHQKRQTVEGKVVVEAVDGGIMLLARDGHLHSVTPKVEIDREETGEAFVPFDADELSVQLLQEFGDDFHIHTTADYVICSDASEPYTKWCGILFQRLSAAFRRQWEKTGPELHKPTSPLVAVIFRDAGTFRNFATKDEGPELAAAQGYYSIRSNRMVMFDLTSDAKTAVRSGQDIARRLAMKPANVATVVHEATHQIAFNSGLHTRYADNPLWLTEGMAMYFETPDLRSPKGWKTAGRVNLSRLKQFKDYKAKRRKDDSLTTLLRDNNSFQSSPQDAYAEAWALNYFLMKTHRQQYVKYLQLIQSKPRLVWDSQDQRIADFANSMGKSTEKLNTEFERYMTRLRR